MLEGRTGRRDCARSQSRDIREGRKVEGNRSGLRGGRAGQQLHRQKESKAKRCLRPFKLVSCPSRCGSGHSPLAQGCPHCPFMAFALLPVCIYLFIAFCGVFFLSNPYCLCCPNHPLSHPAVCAALCLSVTTKIKTNKRQDLCVVSGWNEEEAGWLGVSPGWRVTFSRQ